MANKKISELPEANEFDGHEYAEVLQNGLNKKAPTSYFGITREFNRTFSEELIFNKNEIFHASVIMTDDINLTVGAGGLVDQASSMRFRMTVDGIHSINFGLGFDFLYGIANGEVLDAGTYEFYFLYVNGSVSVSVPGVTAQQSVAITLSAPTNFAAVADGETAIDLTSDNVTNNQGYLTEFSLDGTSGWATLDTSAVDDTTSTQTSLSAGSIRYYRRKTLGNGTTTLDSSYTSVISAQTESSGDTADPVPTFSPENGNSTWTVNRPITITMDEPVRNTDGSEITNANVAALITLKETNSGGANIGFSATIDATKQIITITPTTIYGSNQLVYVAINNFEDVNGNDVTSPVSITFTTTEFTYFDGVANFLSFGDILDSVWAIPDAKFKLRITLNNPILSGTRFLIGKYSPSDNQRSFYWYTIGPDISFAWAKVGSSVNRAFRWPATLIAGEHEYELTYDGSVDTNNGADRVTLKRDGSPVGTKEVEYNSLSLGDIFDSTAQLSFGTAVSNAGGPVPAIYYAYEAKDLIVLSGAGDTVEINVPILITGEDTSGNNRDGTWG